MIAIFAIEANEITLTKEQEKNWQIKTQLPTKSKTLPLGTFMMEVTTPPNLLRAVTLAFEAQVTKLYVASYQNIKKGDLLAEVSGAEWIEAQTEAISNAITLKESQTTASRKNRLCKEGIIPQKECVTVNAIVQNNKARLSASKAVLSAYGADRNIIQEITNALKIKLNLPIRAKTSGAVMELNAQVGKSINASSPLMIIQEKGAMWLESDIPLNSIESLQFEEFITIKIDNQSHICKVLQFSPVISSQNQTLHVRFALPNEATLLSGYRGIAQIIIEKPSLIVDKKAIIKSDNKHISFVKIANGYKSVEVHVLAEGDRVYYLALNDALNAPIAINSLAALKSMMGD
jgi:multidrug efflux pump subunit AcrA (membrane-fusion protein)